MKEPDFPHNEQERMEALLDLEILDTAPEEVFDRITRLAAHIIDAPVVLMTFLDDDRNWFKSKIGVDFAESPRNISFCGHAIHHDEVLMVSDATKDSRFADNPLVTEIPNVKFYAGAPLILSDGIRLGTLCAFDMQPRELDSHQLDALRDLAAVAVDELDLRKSVKVQGQISQELREQAKELQHSNQALEQYVYMAAHDLRAPLKRLINLADLAVLDSDGADSSLVMPMRESAVEMEGLVMGYGRLAGLTQGVTSEQLASTMIDQAREATGQVIGVNIIGDAAVVCDSFLVTQAFVNLLENAHKYGSGDHVVIDLRDDGEEYAFSVSNEVEESFPVDNTIFAPFKRLVSDDRGTGLGLAIVERVAQLHGGSASASCEDKRFEVTLSFPKRSLT